MKNLPTSYSGSGLYELGVTPPAWLPPQRNNYPGILKPQDVVVVYLGCAESVNYHLQRYGQTGAHLEGVRSTRLFSAKNETASKPGLPQLEKTRSFASECRNLSIDLAPGADGDVSTGSNGSIDNTDDLQATSEKKRANTSDHIGNRSPVRGPCLFSEVFALGCSIAFRWAATDSKAAADKAEFELTEVFDYAWKRGGNFRQRSADILAKIVKGGALGSNDLPYGCFGYNSRCICFFFKRSRVGVKIAARKLPDDNHRFVRSRRSNPSGGSDFFSFRYSPPLLPGKTAKSAAFTKLDIPIDRCGILLESGLPCSALPVKGGKRCRIHKKISHKKPARVAHTSSPTYDSNGALPRDTNVSKNSGKTPTKPPPEHSTSCFPYRPQVQPVPGAPAEPKRRGSLSFNSWLRTSELRMAKSREWAELKTPLSPRPEGTRRSSTSYSSILATCEESMYESPCRSPSRREICGLKLLDGTVCPDPPRPDRKRCEAHKGLRNQMLPQSPVYSSTASLRQGFV